MREVTIELRVEAPEEINMEFLTDLLVALVHQVDDRNEVVEYGCHGIDLEEQEEGIMMAVKAGLITDIVPIF